MGGVNLVEESRNILAANAELVSGQLRSCKDEMFLDSQRLHARIAEISEYSFLLAVKYTMPMLIFCWKVNACIFLHLF
jgi:hypothetical protein